MTSRTTVGLVGIGGYGRNYVSAFLDSIGHNDAQLIAAADPRPSACPRIAELTDRALPIYPSIEAMYAEHQPDLVVLSTPIQLHCDQTVFALKHGSHVLCEKPACATTEQIQKMIEARDRAKRQVGIGYQWSFSPTYQSLKKDIHSGVFGAPIRLSTFCCWPRGDHYYARNRWAGRKFDDAGHAVFDSPVNNACAHSLHNMFYILGDALDRSAMPQDVAAELYRANSIENYDTAAIRCTMREDVEILFFTSHVTERDQGPLLRYEFENAVITYDGVSDKGVIAKLPDGTERHYGVASSGIGKLWNMIDAIRTSKNVCCGIEAAAAHTTAMAAAQQNEIIDFPRTIVHKHQIASGRALLVDGLEECLLRCFHENKLPSELGMTWAKPNLAVQTI